MSPRPFLEEITGAMTLEARYLFGPAAMAEVTLDGWRILIGDTVLLGEGRSMTEALRDAKEKNPSLVRP